MLQAFSILAEPEQDPPYFSFFVLDLSLNCFPPPQDLLQGEYLPQGPHTQGSVRYIKTETYICIAVAPRLCMVTN